MPVRRICTHLSHSASDKQSDRECVRACVSAVYLVQVVVLLDEALQLRLHVRDLLLRELVLVQRHACLLQVPQEAQLCTS